VQACNGPHSLAEKAECRKHLLIFMVHPFKNNAAPKEVSRDNELGTTCFQQKNSKG
jgi:hypothetical protein